MKRDSVFDKTTNRWRSLLAQLGVDKKHLTGKHGPCPMCGGTDRFRFDDKEGRGTYYCNQCGPGTPLTMLKKLYGWEPAEVAVQLEKLMVGVAVKPKKAAKIDPEAEERRRAMRINAMRLYWQACEPLTDGCPVREYLRWRGIGPDSLIDDALINVKQRILGGSFEMVCAVRGPGGGAEGVQLHRTIIDGGSFKVMKRLLWRGELPAGAAVPLFRPVPELPLGIAEGVETAMSAAMLFNHPVWAALNTARLKTWRPPPGAYDGIVIFADNDENGAGQEAAEELRTRLWKEGHSVSVRTPVKTGADWNDILAAQQSSLARDTGHQQ